MAKLRRQGANFLLINIYVEQSTSKQRQFFERWNYVKHSRSKWRLFLTHQNYNQQVRRNHKKEIIDIFCLMFRRCIDIESTLIRCSVSIGKAG